MAIKAGLYQNQQMDFFHAKFQQLENLRYLIVVVNADYNSNPLVVPKFGSKEIHDLKIDFSDMKSDTVKIVGPCHRMSLRFPTFRDLTHCYLDFVSVFWQILLDENSIFHFFIMLNAVYEPNRTLLGRKNASFKF